jgi:hypothetical protein
MPWNLGWENQLVYKFGVQYTVNPTIALRAGYNFERPHSDDLPVELSGLDGGRLACPRRRRLRVV